MTTTNFATGPDPLMVNLAWYENLPPKLKLHLVPGSGFPTVARPSRP